MAKQTEDNNQTGELFTTEDKEIIDEALRAYAAIITRQINAERDPQIKQIRENTLTRVKRTWSKVPV